MNQREFLVETGLVIKVCISCGITYAMPKDYMEKLRQNHETFYCPNGHSMYFPTETEEEIKIKELEGSLNICKLNRNLLEEENKLHDYQARYWKGQVTKMKKTQLSNPLDITAERDS